LKWFKLLLLDSDHLPDHFRHAPNLIEAQAQMKEMNKSPVDVIADYLRLLWAHSLAQITRAVTTIVMGKVRLKVVVTMPAIWPLYARLRMKEAVTMAGILDPRPAGETLLSFMSEPEAAALAALADVDGQITIDVSENTEQLKFSFSDLSNKIRNNLPLSYAMLVVEQW
jgi:molecular chaperone DnaK (HSP70)